MTENRITLVNPPFVYFPNLKQSRFNYCRPPLGLCYLAGYVRNRRPGLDDIRIIDTLIEHQERELWVERIAETRPDIVGISVVTPTAKESMKMAADVRKRCPEATLVAGGPHATVLPEELAAVFDAVVTGEGERTFLEIVEKRGERERYGEIQGIIYRVGDDKKRTERRPWIDPLDDIPHPARDLLDRDAYYHSFPHRRRAGIFTTMFTCRGCPNNCYFCNNRSLWNSRVRYHSLDYVKDELETLAKENVSLLFIDDDDFLADRDRATEICEWMIRRGNGMKWICHACAKSVDEELARTLKRCGCVEMQIGVESGNDGILKRLPKCGSKSLIEEKFRILRKCGINVWGTFIVGHDGETRETAMETIRFARRIDPAYASFILLLPFPGSKAFEDFRSKGYLKTEDWDDYTWHGDPVFELPGLTSSDLIRLRALAQKSFYLRPFKLIRLFFNTIASGSMREMLRNFFAWLSIVRNP